MSFPIDVGIYKVVTLDPYRFCIWSSSLGDKA